MMPAEKAHAGGTVGSASVRKPRKPRGRGLRTTTGCAICRKRHMKCDEVRPVCGPCAKGSRNCAYGALPAESSASSENGPGSTSGAAHRTSLPQPASRHASFASTADQRILPSQQWPATPSGEDNVQITSPQSTYSNPPGYGTEAAALRWLGMLATDAADVQLDVRSLESTGDSALAQRYGVSADGTSNNYYSTPSHTLSASPPRVTLRSPVQLLHTPVVPSLPADSPTSADEHRFWQAHEPVVLKDHEHDIFRRFVTGISLWIDLFDPLKHFSTLVPHLALHNQGLMKAALALGARHLSLKPLNSGEVNIDRTAALQYYYETLQYLQLAMRYTSYKNSIELLATTLVVSMYEMIDGAGQGWERHLKGVFWIQRSRGLNGESGGFEQAIWWAWLRQDVWAAFKERRRCFSFFKPTKPYRMMDMWDMASRIVYILAQSVNYSSDEEKKIGETDLASRIIRANTLLSMLEEWRSSISVHFQPLPVDSPSDRAFKPLWIHPGAFGASLQMYSMARILLLIHQPAASGFLEYLGRDKVITESIDTIGGIALKLSDDASRLMSTQCLFAAGLYCTDRAKRACIAELIEDHSAHTGWPSNTNLVQELEADWRKQNPD